MEGAGRFGASDNVIGPFEAASDTAEVFDRLRDRHGSDQGQGRDILRRKIRPQNERAPNPSLVGNPDSSAPAPSSGLLFGDDEGPFRLSFLGKLLGLILGGIDFVVMKDFLCGLVRPADRYFLGNYFVRRPEEPVPQIGFALNLETFTP